MDYLKHESLYRGNIDNRASKLITVCGVGALGSWLVEILVRQGYNGITVIDKDKVENTNLGTQNYCKADVGRSKAVQCANNMIKKISSKVVPIAKELNKSNAKSMLKGSDLVIDVFDDALSRQVVMDVCNELSIPCLHAGMSTDGYSEVCWNEKYKVTAPKTTAGVAPCDYPLAANLVSFTVVLLAEMVNKFLDAGIKKSVEFTWDDLRVDEK